jgi:CheY-like chemotaxis protein
MSRRILVADDSSTIQKVIKIAFSRYPVEMSEAASYIEALSSLSGVRPDALILDASLPGAKGPGDFSKLAEDSGGVPVLLLVGTYETIDEAQFRAAGFHNFLRKPFDSNDLVSQVDQMLGGTLAHGGVSAPPRGDAIPEGSTQRPAHATVIHAGGLGEVQRGARGTNPPPPPGAGGRGTRPPAPPVGASAPPPTPPGRRSMPQMRLDDGDEPVDDTPPPPPSPGRRSEPAVRFADEDDGDGMPPPPPAPGRRSAPAMQLDDDDDGARHAAPPPAPGRATVPPPPAPGRRVSGPPVGLDDDDLQPPAPPLARAGGRRPTLEPRPFDPYADEDGGEEPRLDLRGLDEGAGEPPPLATDERRKGRRAFTGAPPFALEDDSGAKAFRPPLPDEERQHSGNLPGMPDTVPEELVRRLEAQLPALVREAVEAYCERHFKSLAREVIAAELRRLADDKARHLVDP